MRTNTVNIEIIFQQSSEESNDSTNDISTGDNDENEPVIKPDITAQQINFLQDPVAVTPRGKEPSEDVQPEQVVSSSQETTDDAHNDVILGTPRTLLLEAPQLAPVQAV
ncbi:unnamed protein product [Gongylonema pulchrum]|uniref:Uncharacterized protein n=1 Tax=Gongylonema pulchrum TaxID=637853 RepID=A0A183DH15_9BILA|nr:unnamed protein product [Gongylonema pulchrum]